MIKMKLVWPINAHGYFCTTCGRVGELDEEAMMQCGPEESGPCVWVPSVSTDARVRKAKP